MKKYVIIKPNCKELANHVWNYLSIYAYGIETGARVYNPSFFEWHRYFNLIEKETLLTRIASSFPALKSVWKGIGVLYGSYLVRTRAPRVQLTLSMIAYLPPTKKRTVDSGRDDTTYFIGWLFRNPVGLERYREALITAFRPKENILKENKDLLASFRGKRLVGVHLRQRPYKGFDDGSLLVPPSRVRQVVEEYLREKGLNAGDVALVIVSDRDVDPAAFRGFAADVRQGNDVTSLFLLSKCTIVIGSNSTFSNLAAWFGNVPHIVATNEPVDWDYYRTSTAYFENKYATFAQ